MREPDQCYKATQKAMARTQISLCNVANGMSSLKSAGAKGNENRQVLLGFLEAGGK